MVRLSASLRGIFKLFAFTALLTLCVPMAFSQENTGSIQGVVQDANGAAVNGATVSVESPSLVRDLQAVTNQEGSYIFAKLPPGLYTVKVTQQGFKSSKKENVRVTLGGEARVDLDLEAGNVSETVTVTGGDTELIDLTSSKTATKISVRFIENSPKGRSLFSFLSAAPGVLF